MADNTEQKGGLIPPKLNLRKPGVQPVTPAGTASNPLRPQTIKLKPAKAVALPKPSMISTAKAAPIPAPIIRSAEKKETSRIPLGAATASSVPGAIIPSEAPKTIRITPKPAGSPSTIKIQPKSAIQGVPVGKSVDKKKETSRIPLDAALGTGAAEATGPKTIRLKRPSAGPQLKTATKRPKIGEKTGLGATTRMEDTAQIEVQEPATPTRRKTIRVKRPGQAQRKMAPKAVATAPKAVSNEQQEVTVVEDQPNWFFPVCAVLSIFVVIATIYVFASQAVGPNPSLSQLSWYLEAPDLGMPMKIAPPRR